MTVDTPFIEKWRRDYFERDEEEAYSVPISADDLTSEDIDRLLKWKSPFFRSEVRRKLKAQLRTINRLRHTEDLDEDVANDFVRKFYPSYPDGAIVLGSFIKHMLRPLDYPVYDQYVHTAYHILEKVQEDNCLTPCYPTYAKFFTRLRGRLGCDYKVLDEALWAYGRYRDEG